MLEHITKGLGIGLIVAQYRKRPCWKSCLPGIGDRIRLPLLVP